jgi:hypothetical protein
MPQSRLYKQGFSFTLFSCLTTYIRRISFMVTKPNEPIFESGQEPLKKMPKIDPPELATNASYSPKYQADPDSGKKDLANKDRDASFKLPEKVSAADIKAQSFKYGGGRSAGNRSLADNELRKVQEK